MPDLIRPDESSKKLSSQDYRLEEISSPNVCIYLGLSEEELEQSAIISKSFAENLPQASTLVEQQMARRNFDEHREALRLLDKLQIEGRYEEFVAHLASVFAERINPTITEEIFKKTAQFERWDAAWQNFEAGLNSPDVEQRNRFHSFWYGIVAKIYGGTPPLNGYYRAVVENLELFEALEPAQRPGPTRSKRAPIEDSDLLREMKKLVMKDGLSIWKASRKIARTDAMARRLEQKFIKKMKLR